MKISQILLEGGNLAIKGREAQHLDLKVTKRSYMVPKLNELLNAINNAFAKMTKQPLWDAEVLQSGKFLSGSSLHFFNVSGIDDETFFKKKPTVGDIDTMVDKSKEAALNQFLTAYDDKQLGPSIFRGFQRGNEQFSALFELQDPPVSVQIDFEFVEFQKGTPTDWARFSHSSAWEDMQYGIKGVFHKWLIQSITALTRKEFLQRKLVGRGKAREEQDVPMTDNMYSFAVSSKEGGGLRAKYEPVLGPNGKPLVKDGLPVMSATPASGYSQDVGQIFSTLLGKRLPKNLSQEAATSFWSFTGLVNLLAKVLTPEEKAAVVDAFILKTIGPGAQGMYKNNPEKDIKEKMTALDYIMKVLKVSKPAEFDQILQSYRSSYKMTESKLTEAPNYKRQGIQHIYNPGSTVEIKDADFIELCKEIAENGGSLDNAPINLKVDGAGIRFGKDASGKPFFMTSKVTEPKYIENYGDFTNYAKSMGAAEDRIAFAGNYDKALKTILTSKFMNALPPDTIVQAEMLFNDMAQKSEDGYKFVNINYDPKKLGKTMTLVPFMYKTYSTGETRPDAAKIQKALLQASDSNIKLISNNLQQKGINVSKIVDPIVKNAESLLAALKIRGENPQKEKAKEVISHAKKSLSDAIITNPNIKGKDQLGNNIEGLVINMPSGRLLKVTSQTMKDAMLAKQQQAKVAPTGKRSGKTAVVTAGSFVGHKGHEQLINFVLNKAKQLGADPYVYISPSMGPDDPIPPQMKLATWQKLYPNYANIFQVWQEGGTPVKKIEKELVTKTNPPPYDKIIVMVGEDRYEGFKNWMDHLSKRMKNPQYPGFEHVEFDVEVTPRDPNQGGTGISFTQCRNVLKDPKLSEEQQLAFWTKAFDVDKLGVAWIKKLMDTARQNMTAPQPTAKQQKIKEFVQRVRPMLKEASMAQKVKVLKLLKESLSEINSSVDEDREEALQFAKKAHAGQERAGGLPYITHPIRVAQSVEQYKKSHNLDAIISAALLHDTVEDTDTTHEDLEALFGGLVASLVKELTSDKEKIQQMGKAEYLAQKMATMSSYALVIKLADRLDNVQDIRTAKTPEWRAKYKAETEKILNYIEKNRVLSGTHKKFISLIRDKLAEVPANNTGEISESSKAKTKVTKNQDYIDEK